MCQILSPPPIRYLVLIAFLAACDVTPSARAEETGRVRVAEATTPPTPVVPWTFAVLSDIHTPNDGTVWPELEQVVAALVELKPRLVIVTGDHTNGDVDDGKGRIKLMKKWMAAVKKGLQPLRDAGIPVLPVAGNHDSYKEGHREKYAEAFADLEDWARPLQLDASWPEKGISVTSAPFSYSVDVDGVHLTLAHVVAQDMKPALTRWIAADLASAADARLRLVFGHVPLSSVIGRPSDEMIRTFGGVLEAGKADLYIAGHEHVVWDEDVALPGGGSIRQVLVGCSSGYYNYGPSGKAQKRAGCKKVEVKGLKKPARCKMPNGGGEFLIYDDKRQKRRIQHYRINFTMFTVDDTTITATPMTISKKGEAVPFYL
jgi:3',5'-cyclic AMP phosphodiesterase CpdA